MKLAIISHTEHFLDEEGNPVGWGATVREINNLTKIFSKIIHIAPLHEGKAPDSSLKYTSEKIEFVALQPSGGQNLLSKLMIFYTVPFNLKIIHNKIKEVDYVQFRGPTNLGIYMIPYLSFRKKPKKWFKYAGNWVQENPPASYAFQRWWLKSNFQRSIVTVNGKWPDQEPHVLSFENPCITSKEYEEAKIIASAKEFSDKLTICFVGRVEEAKGVGRIIDAFKFYKGDNIEKIIFVGDGPEKKIFETRAEGLSVKYNFTGSLSRYKLAEVYKSAHIFCLPSTASEGFPKVIAEAAAYGCVPVVSNISSIGQYVIHNKNGILLEKVNPNYILKIFIQLLEDRNKLKYLSSNVVNIAEAFTFDNYNYRITHEVIPQLK
ncbi:hypothetical protein BH23BAC1_BH23BAC1_15650 [soil metagenome]